MSDSGGVRWKDVLPAVLFLRSVETINVCFFSFQSGVSSWATWGVHPGLHPGIEEVCPERHRLPPADIWSAGIPTGAAQRFCSSPLLSSPPSPPPTPSLYFDLVSVSVLHTRPFSPSIYFLPWHLFNFLSFEPHLLCSSLDHLRLSPFTHLHCYSCAFDDEALESQRVPIITESLRADLNTQCVWWMEATSPH